MENSTLGADHYAEHLARIDGGNEAVAAQDILNAQGVLVIRKGQRIDQARAARIIQHKLLCPLDEQVSLESSISAGGLHDLAQAFLCATPGLQSANQRLGFDKDFGRYFKTSLLPPIITQKLTVMQRQMPYVLKKGLFCAWLCALLAHELGLDKHRRECAFYAGLFRDMGFLHLSPGLTNPDKALSVEDWRAIQSHAVVGYIIVERLQFYDPIIPAAILEHHERADGTGYPSGTLNRVAGGITEIVAMCDAIQALYLNKLVGWGLMLGYIQSFLRLNASTYSYEVYQAALAVIRRADLPQRLPDRFSDRSVLCAWTAERNMRLQIAWDCTEIIGIRVAAQPPTRHARAVVLLNEAARLTMQRSGLLSDEITGWLHGLKSAPHSADANELLDIFLLQHELAWQLKQLVRTLDACLAEDEEEKNPLRRELSALGRNLRDQIAEIAAVDSSRPPGQ